MNTKEKLLSLLDANRGCYLSGEDIARQLSLSRASVWKAVKALRDEGYPIDGVSNRGYRLAPEADRISIQGIQKYLKPSCGELTLEVFPTLLSTNAMAREKASTGIQDGYVVVANEQTGGRGRNGKYFYSPLDTGIYFSLVLRPLGWTAQQAVRLTAMAAVAVCDAIESVSGQLPEIKWVNDIFINGRKVCGILTEASMGLEDASLEYVIIGIGINALFPKDGFPEDIAETAGCVFPEPVGDERNRLAAEILNQFMTLYTSLPDSKYMNRYRSRCNVIDRKVLIQTQAESLQATALDVDDDCRLIVKLEDGTIHAYPSGKIRITLS